MAQTSEAACLLQTGAAYPNRLGFRDASGAEIFVGLRPAGFSVYFDDAPIYHLDLEGRWQRAFLDGTHCLKGLDATVRNVDRLREGENLVLRRRTLSYAESSDLDAEVRGMAIGLLEGIVSGRLVAIDPPGTARPIAIPDLLELLERVARWDAAAWFAHRERYAATYGPLPFLPPDLPDPVVLQKTLGHAGGRAFGGAAPAPHYVRSAGEFADHARAVRGLMGRRLAKGQPVFLAGADAARLPAAEVLDALQTIRATFPDAPVHAFLDDFAPGLADRAAWGDLAAAGLRRMTLGVASGDGIILAKDGQEWSESDLASLVVSFKAVKLSVGLVVLIGSGGQARSGEHVEATVGLVASLPLGRGDLVTLVDRRSLEAPRVGEDSGSDWLSDAETAGQTAEFRRRLSTGGASNGPRVIPYNPDRRWT